MKLNKEYKMTQLSPHFSRSEIACKCGCGFDTFDAELLMMLENIRGYFNQPITINSGCRCPAYNESIGGSRNSLHKLGRAADITVKDIEPDEVAAYLELVMTHGGIGRYNTFTHVDTRTNDYIAGWSGNY